MRHTVSLSFSVQLSSLSLLSHLYLILLKKFIFCFSAIFCDFETDFCGYELTGEEGFAFVREVGQNFNSITDGPLSDSTGSRERSFAYITARTSKREGEIATIEMPMIHGANHEVECLSFWFSIKVKKTRKFPTLPLCWCHSVLCKLDRLALYFYLQNLLVRATMLV
jgi:hypothetical protein